MSIRADRAAVRSESLSTSRFGRRVSRAFAAAGALAVIGLACSASLAQDLGGQIRRLVSSAKVGTAEIGISVVDVSTGEVIFSQRAGEAMIPASNMKILTSAAALWTLGPDHVFRTELREVDGRLVIVGSGDPALADPELLSRAEPKMTVEDILGRLADAVKKADITEYSEIVLDDRIFDREYVHPTWPAGQLDKWYCAEVRGITFHANLLSFYPRPSRDGRGGSPSIRVSPEVPWIDIENRARTVKGERNTVSVLRTNDPDRFRFTGEVAVPSAAPIELAITDSTELFGRLLSHRLREVGITSSGGKAGSVRPAAQDEEWVKGRTIAVITTPMSDVLRRCNADSYNLYAECLLKAMGHHATGLPGSWDNGGRVLTMLLSEKLGPSYAAGTTVADGSGMSRRNAVSAETITRWLTVVSRDKSIADDFVQSLPAPGEGTLKRRFNGARLKGEVRAKSGYINQVRGLSGYVTNPQTGDRIAISFLANDIPGDVHNAVLDLAEEIFKAADTHLARRAAEQRPSIGG
jgi:serine-type D-Ala-D-Ala carboxypeptidase/endopeptidase (penicillin-binding protein 4)